MEGLQIYSEYCRPYGGEVGQSKRSPAKREAEITQPPEAALIAGTAVFPQSAHQKTLYRKNPTFNQQHQIVT